MKLNLCFFHENKKGDDPSFLSLLADTLFVLQINGNVKQL